MTRLDALIDEARGIVDLAVEEHITSQDKELAAKCLLFSGGNDSTVLAHLLRQDVDYAVHINTGIGIERTRQFVRDTCADWGLPLIEEHGESYRDLVIDQGFPGPAHHFKMYQRLKERGLRKVRRSLVLERTERVLFIAGRRRQESERRKDVPASQREGSVVWASPLVSWEDQDMRAYRERFDVPRNPVSDDLHMSGECLCGAFAKPGELDEIDFFYPEVAVEIRQLEEEVRAAGHPEERCRWGWGAYRKSRPTKQQLGPLCHQCSLWQDDPEVTV